MFKLGTGFISDLRVTLIDFYSYVRGDSLTDFYYYYYYIIIKTLLTFFIYFFGYSSLGNHFLK